MKHSPGLLLGLATLVLSSASASASAKEPLTFEPAPLNRSVASAMSSKPTNLSGAIDIGNLSENPSENPAVDRSAVEPAIKSKQPSDRPGIPLFELPPFQSDPLAISDGIPESTQDNTSNGTSDITSYDIDQSDHQLSRHFADAEGFDSSPFQLPEHLTDSDLFEDPSLQNSPRSYETNISPSHFGSPSDSKDLSEAIPLKRPAGTDTPITSEIDGKSDLLNHSSENHSSENVSIGLSFDPPSRTKSSFPVTRSMRSLNPVTSSVLSKPDADAVSSAIPHINSGEESSIDRLFDGGPDSLIAVAIGSAEGTRTPDGGKNPAYHGHTDPGNGVWNLGSFSYQHEASSPEEADTKQLARLRNQSQMILDKATAKGMDLSLEEKLNGIDLANQAPKAALDQQGSYIDWLADARASGLEGKDAILWARVHSFLDPHTKTWNAPGLGNSEERITRDQERRMLAIAKAITNYMQNIASRP